LSTRTKKTRKPDEKDGAKGGSVDVKSGNAKMRVWTRKTWS